MDIFLRSSCGLSQFPSQGKSPMVKLWGSILLTTNQLLLQKASNPAYQWDLFWADAWAAWLEPSGGCGTNPQDCCLLPAHQTNPAGPLHACCTQGQEQSRQPQSQGSRWQQHKPQQAACVGTILFVKNWIAQIPGKASPGDPTTSKLVFPFACLCGE